jgi:hypothetical protein
MFLAGRCAISALFWVLVPNGRLSATGGGEPSIKKRRKALQLGVRLGTISCRFPKKLINL